MNELINRLKERANLSEEQAAQAVDVVRGFLNERLPAGIQGPVNSLLTGQNIQSASDAAGSLLGGMFGNKEG